jgi:hypothetical protein
MRRGGTMRRLAGMALAGVLSALGCDTTPKYNEFKPDHPEEFKLPPEGTYTGAVQYPKEYLNQIEPHKDPSQTDALPPPPGGNHGMGVGPGKFGQ